MSYIKLLNNDLDIYPIFWKWKKFNLGFLSMDDNSKFITSLTTEEIKNQKYFNEKIKQFWLKNNLNLIISGFLEKREVMFRSLWFEQMIFEKRFYHLWLDLSVSKWLKIYAPLDWEVYYSWYEKWAWNYGWYIVIKHNLEWFIFYSLYWHQNKNSLPVIWTKLKAGNIFSSIWDYFENWWYFHHLHLQLITQEWIDSWFIAKWYVNKNDIASLNKYVLDPSYIFRY